MNVVKSTAPMMNDEITSRPLHKEFSKDKEYENKYGNERESDYASVDESEHEYKDCRIGKYGEIGHVDWIFEFKDVADYQSEEYPDDKERSSNMMPEETIEFWDKGDTSEVA